ncbi:deoxyribose-phosphate aldolase [Pseudomarimonas arenosa]|uniref:Deoxyribose-phosphate aldolase n=1 Tax=Pseudomarimonas arenosa TaxID=2774145 RepID=A0AAW3ZJE4_9GAMM|nr:deoxyribose-phosphate aldolase [Pseudomarimonas arenosa]MBD8526200.1 deoxyribose-phosphate aldolase [Pseudomarimonas arenosa]
MKLTPDELRQLLACIDLTSLNEDDDPARIEWLCRQAAEAPTPPAALCVYPEYVWMARQRLKDLGLAQVALASVANFPDGSVDALRVARECHRLRSAGADEIDVVLPYRALLGGDTAGYSAVARAAREAAGDCRLKCILETGELGQAERIAEAAQLALDAGADFLKTSTGKVRVNATPEAAEILLSAIAAHPRRCGFKAAGGIRSVDEAERYVDLARRLLGAQAFDPARFRIGASALFDQVLVALGESAQGTGRGSY